MAIIKSFFCLILILSVAVLFTACGEEPANKPTNTNSPQATNSPAANQQADNPLATEKRPEAATTNDAPTITPIVATYFKALSSKDDGSLVKVLSASYLTTLRADMKDEGRTGLAEYLAEYELGTGKPMEARNEKIDGDKAVAEVRGGAYLNWTRLTFINENGSWKFSGESPDFNSVTGK